MRATGRCGAIAVACALAVLAPSAAAAGGSRDDDRSIADESVLATDDVPSVFEEQPSGGDDEPPPGKACASIRKGRKALDGAPNAETDFATSGGARINNKVSVFGTKKQAQKAIGRYSTSSADDCFVQTYEQLFADQIDDPTAEIDVRVSQSINKYGVGDTSFGYDLRIDVSSQDLSESVFLELVLVREGRAVDAFAFLNPGTRPPADDVAAMVRSGVDRLEQAL